MRLLADTHAMPWWLRDDPRLSRRARACRIPGARSRVSDVFRRDKPSLTVEPPPSGETPRPADLAEELVRLRRVVLRQGHAQELFQARVDEAVARLAPGSAAPPPAAPPEPTEAQLRALMALDRAVLELLRMASPAAGGAGVGSPEAPASRSEAAHEDAPASLREGLSLLQVRVRNLAHSLGLEPIPALGRPFDDRRHRADGVVERADLPEGRVVEELLPGYTLGERVVRPARVVVNRRAEGEP